MAVIPTSKLIDQTLYAKFDTINIRKDPSLDTPVIAQVHKGKPVGIVTAWMEDTSAETGKKIWFRVIGIKTGWVRQDVVTNSSRSVGNSEDAQGYDLLQNLVKTDNELYHNLLLNAESIQRLKERGITVSTYENRLNRIISSYTERQNKIKHSNLVNFQTRLNQGFQWLADKFSDLIHGVGALPLIPVAIGAAIGLGTGFLIYLTFRADYSESTLNLKESKELQKLLNQVDKEVAGAIRSDLEKQIDTAYASGKTSGKISFLGGSVKNLALIGLGVLAVVKLPELLQGKQTRR